MSAGQELSAQLHPAFWPLRGGNLRPHEQIDARELWRHLSAGVYRDPLDLESHARRVLLCIKPVLADRLFGALIDLFLALGAQGRDLREHLLSLAEPVLDPEEAQFLRDALDAGLHRATSLPSAPGSVLHTSLVGSPTLVAMVRHEAATLSALEQGVSLLEHGDLDGARMCFEEGLLADPDDAELCSELLGIYRHSRDEAAQAAMAERLRARHARLPPGWA